MLSTGSTLNFGIATVGGVFAGSLVTALLTGRFELEGYRSPRHMLRSAGGAALMGVGRRDGVRLLGRAGPDGNLDAGAGVLRRGRGHPGRHARSACAARSGCGRCRLEL